MRWAILTREEKLNIRIDKYCQWHTWFAWFPVTIEHPDTNVTYRVWLERVGRKYRIDSVVSDYEHQLCRGIVVHRYCFHEDLIVNAINDNELIDNTYR